MFWNTFFESKFVRLKFDYNAFLFLFYFSMHSMIDIAYFTPWNCRVFCCMNSVPTNFLEKFNCFSSKFHTFQGFPTLHPACSIGGSDHTIWYNLPMWYQSVLNKLQQSHSLNDYRKPTPSLRCNIYYKRWKFNHMYI